MDDSRSLSQVHPAIDLQCLFCVPLPVVSPKHTHQSHRLMKGNLPARYSIKCRLNFCNNFFFQGIVHGYLIRYV
jgi:hypothetical protein